MKKQRNVKNNLDNDTENYEIRNEMSVDTVEREVEMNQQMLGESIDHETYNTDKNKSDNNEVDQGIWIPPPKKKNPLSLKEILK